MDRRLAGLARGAHRANRHRRALRRRYRLTQSEDHIVRRRALLCRADDMMLTLGARRNLRQTEAQQLEDIIQRAVRQSAWAHRAREDVDRIAAIGQIDELDDAARATSAHQ